ncbi:MAG TPA: hypothetical protein VK861_05080 [Bacteroidales bacterium]|nr:hypothetical protein [Bacteroidales bacterium]
MKRIALLVTISVCLMFSSCSKEKESQRFKWLTTPVWTTEQLLVNGVSADGPGDLLEGFKGDSKFNKDGTGTFGSYTGTWSFSSDESQLIIQTPDLPIPVITTIAELTSSRLDVTTAFPNQTDPANPYNIRMVFRVK